MVAFHPKSESPTHELAKRLLKADPDTGPIDCKVALLLQDLMVFDGIVCVAVDRIADDLDTTRTRVIRAINLMRRLDLIAAEFCGTGELINACICAPADHDRLPDFVVALVDCWIEDQRGGASAA